MLSEIKGDLALTFAQAGMLFSLPLVMLVTLAIPGGMLADRVGIRKAAGVGASVMGVGSFLRGMSTDFTMLLVFTVLYGVGWSLAVPNLPKLVGGWFPKKFAGTATGIYSTGIVTGCALALAITLPIIHPITGSWRGTLYIWGSMALVVAVLWWVLVRDPPRSRVGQLENPDFAPPTESRKSYAGAWKDFNVWMVALMLSLHNVAFYTVMGWFPTFLELRGATATVGALITSTIEWVGIPSILLIPLTSDRVGLRKPFYWVSAAVYAAICYIVLLTPWSFAWFMAVLLGVTLNSAFVLCLILPLDLAEERYVGLATGIVLSIGYVGGLLGPWVAGYIVDISGSFTYAFYFLSIVSIISVVVCILGIPETGRKGNKLLKASRQREKL